MTTHVGSAAPPVLYALPGITPDYLDYQYNETADGWLDGESVTGTKTDTQPVVENPGTHVGHWGTGFSDDF